MAQFNLLLIATTMNVIITGYCVSDKENICPTLTHQRNITISNIMGTWYAVRGIEHTDLNAGSNKPGSTTDCRALHLSQNDQSEIIFQWNGNNVVKFKANSNNPNMWQSISNSPSQGLPIKTLQVTEVDDKHIVITSCTPSKRISSAVISREAKFYEQSVNAASKKLAEQGFKTVNTFDRCQNKS